MKQINTILLLPTKPIHTNYCRQIQNILIIKSVISQKRCKLSIVESQYCNNLINRNNATLKFKYTIFRIVGLHFCLHFKYTNTHIKISKLFELVKYMKTRIMYSLFSKICDAVSRNRNTWVIVLSCKIIMHIVTPYIIVIEYTW